MPMLMGQPQSFRGGALASAMTPPPPQQTGGGSILDRFKDLTSPDIAAALLSGGTPAESFANMFGVIGKNRQRDRAKSLIEGQFPDLAPFVDAGASVEDVLGVAMKKKMGGDTQYALNPIWGTGPDGSPALGTLGNDGSFKQIETPPGFKPSTGVDKIDLGDRWALQDKRSGAIVDYMLKENYKEAFDKGAGGAAGTYAGQAPERKSKALNALDALDNQRVIVDDDIKRSVDMIRQNPNMTTGLVGGLAKALPGSPAFRLKQRLDTIKANVGFDKLQSMREASPTGGALGAVSEQENLLLQAVFGSLDQANDPQEILYNLERLQLILANSKDARRQAYARDFGEDAPASAVQPLPGGGATTDKPRRRYNPNTGELE